MKTNKYYKSFLLSLVFLLVSLIGFSVPTIFKEPSTNQYYCRCNIPGGTFYFYISEINEDLYSYSWSCGGTDPYMSNSVSYPSYQTTYSCRVTNMETMNYNDYYYTVYVQPFQTYYTVGGGSCCSTPATVSLSGSETGVTYHLFKDGVDQNINKSGTGSALYWTGLSALGVYTVQAWYGSYPYPTCKQTMNSSATISHICCKLGVSDIDETLNIDLKIFPNPNNGNFTLETSTVGEYVLMNELGQEIKQFKIVPNNTSIEIKGVKPGVYFLKNLESNTKSVTKIIVLE